MFTRDLIQVISDWQRGGDAKQKERRAAALKQEATKLPDDFKQISKPCFRQIALTGSHLMYMGTHYELSESISSWTKSVEIAKDFKGGVPPPGDYQGVIFSIIPTPESIVLDLTALFADSDFVTSVERHKDDISDYGSGIGRYGNSQEEIVLEISELPLENLLAWGGYSSQELPLAKMYFGHTPNKKELEDFRTLMEKAGHKAGPYWLFTPEAVARTSESLKHHAQRLSNRRST